MAQGSLLFVDNFSESLCKANHNIEPGNDVVKCMLISEGIASVTTSSVDSSAFTEVSGTNYTAGGETLTMTLSETGGTTTIGSSANPAWTQDGAGPTDVKTALIYNTTSSSEDLIAYVDMTIDAGTTPISLVAGNISVTFPSGVIGTVG